LLLTAGCDLHDFIHWSPDGQHAFVQGNDGTWLVDSSGAILGPATDARRLATGFTSRNRRPRRQTEDLG